MPKSQDSLNILALNGNRKDFMKFIKSKVVMLRLSSSHTHLFCESLGK